MEATLSKSTTEELLYLIAVLIRVAAEISDTGNRDEKLPTQDRFSRFLSWELPQRVIYLFPYFKSTGLQKLNRSENCSQ